MTDGMYARIGRFFGGLAEALATPPGDTRGDITRYPSFQKIQRG